MVDIAWDAAGRFDSPVRIVALMVATGALLREESRGGHCRVDFPAAEATGRHSETTLDAALRTAGAFAGTAPARRVA